MTELQVEIAKEAVLSLEALVEKESTEDGFMTSDGIQLALIKNFIQGLIETKKQF